MKRVFLSILSCFLAITLGCSKGASRSKKTLSVNFMYEPTILDPRRGADGVTSTAHFMLFEGLTRMTPKSTHEPALAEAIDISENKLIYTFSLRESYWSDGKPVVAEDFAFAWRSMLEPDFPCPNAHLLYPILNAEKIKRGALASSELGVEAIDAKTLRVTLESPTPYFLDLTSFCVLFPVPSHIAKADPHWADSLGSNFVNNGPFVLKEWRRQDQMVFVKNKTFWEAEKVHLGRVNVAIVDNQITTLSMYQKGEVDIMGSMFTSIPSDCIPSLAAENLLQSQPLGATTMFSFNLGKEIFANKHIRKAFAYSVDRQSIIENITGFDEIAACSCISPSLKGGIIKNYYQDANYQRAQEELELGLEELGITRKDLSKLKLSYHKTDSFKRLAQALQRQWHKTLGILVKLDEVDFKILMDKLNRRNYDLSLFMWIVQYNDQMNVLDRFKLPSNPKNYPGWENQQYISLLNQSAYARNETERARILEEAEKIMVEEMPLSCLYHWNNIYMQKEHITGFFISPVGSVHLNDVDIQH